MRVEIDVGQCPPAFVVRAVRHDVDMTAHLCLQDGGWWSIPTSVLQEECDRYHIMKARHGRPDFLPIYADVFKKKPHLFRFTGRRSAITLRSRP